MKADRPVNLDLTKYRFPRMAIVSIMHRISGVVLFLALPFLMYLLYATLHSAASFQSTMQMLQMPLMKIIMLIISAAVMFHLIAGIRHIIMDFGLFESLRGGRMTANLVFLLAIIMVILMGVWIW